MFVLDLKCSTYSVELDLFFSAPHVKADQIVFLHSTRIGFLVLGAYQCTVNNQGTFCDLCFINMDNVDVSLIFVGKMSAFKYLLN